MQHRSAILRWVMPDPPHVLSPPGKHADWTMSEERVHLENLVNSRLTSFLTIFGAVIAGAVALNGHLAYQFGVLAIGAILLPALTMAISRAQIKLELTLAALNREHTHPVAWSNRQGLPDRPYLRIVGYLVPKICCGIILMGTAAAGIVLAGRGLDYFTTFLTA